MKKVLLTTTAVVFTAGFASAGDMSMSGSIDLTYSNFGTGSIAGGDSVFTSEADLDVAASSSSGSISMSGSLELDEGGNDAAAVTLSSGGFSMTYDANDVGGLSVDADVGNTSPAGVNYVANTTADGEGDAYGDYSLSYTAGGLSATYVGDDDSDDSVLTVAYTSGALSLSMEIEDLTDTYIAAASETTTTSATYVTGAYTIGLSADDADGWDASVAMAAGDTTVTVAADEAEVFSVALAYAAGDITASASQEFSEGDATTFGVSYAAGAVTFGAAYDSGNTGFGDEADTVISATYVDGDVTIAGKANNQDEMEVSVSFAF
jgi:outer membrane protein OmpU